MFNYRPDTPWMYLNPEGFRLAPDGSGTDNQPRSFGFGSYPYSPGSSEALADSSAYGLPYPLSQAPIDPAYNSFLLASTPRHPFQEAFDQLARIYAGLGALKQQASGIGSVAAGNGPRLQGSSVVPQLGDPLAMRPSRVSTNSFTPLSYGNASIQAPVGQFTGGDDPFFTATTSAVPRLPPEGEVISDAMPDDGLRDGQQYAEVRRPLPMRGVRAGVDEEGRDVLVRDESAEPDPFETLKRRGYRQPAEDPGNGSTIVSELRKDYGQHRPFYHRYEFKDPLCDLGTPGCSVEAAYEALKRYAVPGGPAREVAIEHGDISAVSFRGVPGGHVETLVEPASNSIVNRTRPGHPFDDGYAQRQIVVENGKVYLRTFGEGNNTSLEKASANMMMAKPAFAESTANIQAALSPSTPAKSSDRWSR